MNEGILRKFCLVPRGSSSNLDSFTLRPLARKYVSSEARQASRSSTIVEIADFLPEIKTCVSSAYCTTKAPSAYRLRSFTKMVKSRGPKEDP